jgi:selenocysteine lyase/cysteine desulfurase
MNPLGDEEVAELRKEFPALGRMTYFTSNGLGVLPLRSAQALATRLRELSESAIAATIFGNSPLLAETRGKVARLLGCDPEEVAFSRNTSEGLLWAAEALRWLPGDEVLVARGEYPANVLPWIAQASRGVTTRLLAQRERRITPELVAEAWGERTRALAVSFVQWNSGFRADLAGLARVVHARGGLLFCDAIQGLGALRLDVREAGVDVLAAGTHKWLLGLQGLGVFYCTQALLGELEARHVGPASRLDDRDPDDVDARYDGAFAPEARRFEEGTRNYLGIAALGESLALIEAIGIERIEARIHALTEHLVAGARQRGCRIESPRGPGEWSGIVLFAPPAGGPAAAEIVEGMIRRGIAIHAQEGCLHAGVHFYNTREEIDRMLATLDEICGRAAGGAGGS